MFGLCSELSSLQHPSVNILRPLATDFFLSGEDRALLTLRESQ